MVRSLAVQRAASSDDLEVADALIRGGADIDASGGSIGSPLENAVGYGCCAPGPGGGRAGLCPGSRRPQVPSRANKKMPGMLSDWSAGPGAALVAAESFSVDNWQHVHLHNLVDGLVVGRLPARRRLCGCAKVWALPPGDHRARLVLVDPDGQEIGSGPPTVVRPLPGSTSCTVLAAFSGLALQKAGRHELALEIDGHMLATLPLEVVVGREPGDGRE